MNTYLKQLMDAKLVKQLSNKICSNLGVERVEISVMYTPKFSSGIMRLIDAEDNFIGEYEITDFVCKKCELSRYALDHKSKRSIDDEKVEDAYFSAMSQLFSDYKENCLANLEIGVVC